MKNAVLIIFVFLIILGGGAFFLSQQSNNDASMTSIEDTMDPYASPTYSEQPITDGQTASSRYVVHAKDVLNIVQGKKVVLFFFASWCPTCIPADVDFSKNAAKIPEDVVVIRVNYNDNATDQEEKDLARKYGITYQHTFVQIDSDGNEVAKWNGGQTEELLANIQ